MFEEDDSAEPQTSHRRLWVLITALVATVVVAGVGLWWLFRPHPSRRFPPLNETTIPLISA